MINIAYSETKFLHCPKLGSKDMYICLTNKYNDSAESESILFFVGYGGWKFPRWSEYKKNWTLPKPHLLVYSGQLFITDSTCYKLQHNENRPVCAYKACTWCIGWISYALFITSWVRYNSAAQGIFNYAGNFLLVRRNSKNMITSIYWYLWLAYIQYINSTF